jgi:hypothetical protein
MPSAQLVEPSWNWVPEYHKTYGDEVADLAALAGFEPDPEQRLILDAAFAVDRSGRAVALEVATICARQNLKTGALKQMALGWLFITEQNLIVWSAHEFNTAQEAFRDMTILIESTPDLDREVKQIHRGNGDEAIELLSGQRLKFKARTKGGGRGLTGDKIVLDEAFALRAVHMGALMPTLSAVDDPQLVYASSAGLVDSAVLRAVRDRGRAGGDPSLVYQEWGDPSPGGCASEDCDHHYGVDGCALDDVERWRLANPAIGRRISVEYIEKERRALPPEEFARERLGWWDEPGEVDNGLSVDDWNALEDEAADPGTDVVIGADVAPGQASASVVAFGAGALELVDRRPSAAWLPDRLDALAARNDVRSIAYDPAGPIGNLLPQFTQRVLDKLVPVEGKDSVRAVGAFVAAVSERSFRHRGEHEFTSAVAGAQRREVGDGHKWSRKDSTVDITPLVAATVAMWASVSGDTEEIRPTVHFL